MCLSTEISNGTLGVSEDLMDATGNGGAASATRGNGTYTTPVLTTRLT